MKTYEIEFYKENEKIRVFIKEGNGKIEHVTLKEFYYKYEDLKLIIYTEIKNRYPEIEDKFKSYTKKDRVEEIILYFIKNYFYHLDSEKDVVVKGNRVVEFNLEETYIKFGYKDVKEDKTYTLK